MPFRERADLFWIRAGIEPSRKPAQASVILGAGSTLASPCQKFCLAHGSLYRALANPHPRGCLIALNHLGP